MEMPVSRVNLDFQSPLSPQAGPDVQSHPQPSRVLAGGREESATWHSPHPQPPALLPQALAGCSSRIYRVSRPSLARALRILIAPLS